MKAALLSQYYQPLEIVNLPVPNPKPGEVLVKVEACGVCGSDHFLQTGGFQSTLPIIPGHEASGQIVRLGEGVKTAKVGDRVAIYYIISCGTCKFCKSGRTNICQSVKRLGVDVDGAWAEYISVPEENVILIPDEVNYIEAAVITDAVSTPYHALKIANVNWNETVLIIGIGGIGSNAIQLAKLMGGKVIAVSRSQSKLQLAKDFGADIVLDSTDDDTLVKKVKEVTDGIGADVVLQCAPSARMDQIGFQCLSNGGRMMTIAANQDRFPLRSVDFIWGEKRVEGSRGFTKKDIAECIELFRDKKISLQHLTNHSMPINQINDALHHLNNPDVVRSVILPTQ